MGDIDFSKEMSIYLVEARPVLWNKTDDVYKDRNETKKKGMERSLCLSSRRL